MTATGRRPTGVHRPGEATWTPLPFEVTHVERELPDTVSFGLRPRSGAAAEGALAPAAGQFNMLWAFGVGEVPISASGLATSDRPMLHTVRDVGAVTAALCAVEPGDTIGCRGPFGSTWGIDRLAAGEATPDLVLVAGGLGLAPLRPVVEAAVGRRDRFRHVVLLVGARSPDEILFEREVAAWRAGGVDVRVTVDHAGRAWRGPIGVVTRLLGDAIADPSRTHAMVCGPEVMMRIVARELVDLEVPAEHIEVSLERNMGCGTGRCGHCQLQAILLCREGPVLRWPSVESILRVPEL